MGEGTAKFVGGEEEVGDGALCDGINVEPRGALTV